MNEHFTVNEVKKIAELAHIELRDDEIIRMTKDLNVINDAIEKVSEVASDNIEGSSHPIEIANVFREDIPATLSDDLLTTSQAISGGPKTEDNQFLAPQILGED